MMKMLKAEGVENVTAEVCPHHFILTSDDIERDDPNYKMNPPLRTRKDVDALIEGLKEGYIQVISTDHAPHTQKDKTGSMRTAAFGIVGIETSFALSYTALVETGILTLSPACREDELQSGSDSEPAMWNLTERTSGRCDNRGH